MQKIDLQIKQNKQSEQSTLGSYIYVKHCYNSSMHWLRKTAKNYKMTLIFNRNFKELYRDNNKLFNKLLQNYQILLNL